MSAALPTAPSFCRLLHACQSKMDSEGVIRSICCIWSILQQVEGAAAAAAATGLKASFSSKHFWICFRMWSAVSEAAHQVMLYLFNCTLQHLPPSIKPCYLETALHFFFRVSLKCSCLASLPRAAADNANAPRAAKSFLFEIKNRKDHHEIMD